MYGSFVVIVTSESESETVTSPGSAADDVYEAVVSAVQRDDASLGDSASALYGIASAFDVTVWTENATYSPRDIVFIWTLVEASGMPIPGAGVALTITTPDGSRVNLTATTATNGYAQASYRLGRSDPQGTYQVDATAGTAPGPRGSSATTFSVTGSTGGGNGRKRK